MHKNFSFIFLFGAILCLWKGCSLHSAHMNDYSKFSLVKIEGEIFSYYCKSGRKNSSRYWLTFKHLGEDRKFYSSPSLLPCRFMYDTIENNPKAEVLVHGNEITELKIGGILFHTTEQWESSEKFVTLIFICLAILCFLALLPENSVKEFIKRKPLLSAVCACTLLIMAIIY